MVPNLNECFPWLTPLTVSPLCLSPDSVKLRSLLTITSHDLHHEKMYSCYDLTFKKLFRHVLETKLRVVLECVLHLLPLGKYHLELNQPSIL